MKPSFKREETESLEVKCLQLETAVSEKQQMTHLKKPEQICQRPNKVKLRLGLL